MFIDGIVLEEESRSEHVTVLELVILVLASVQVIHEVVHEFYQLQSVQNLCGSLSWVSNIIQFYLNLFIFGDLP